MSIVRRQLFPTPPKMRPSRKLPTTTIALGPVEVTPYPLHLTPYVTAPKWLFSRPGTIEWRILKHFVRALFEDAHNDEDANLVGQYGLYLDTGRHWRHFGTLEAHPEIDHDQFIFKTDDWPFKKPTPRCKYELPKSFCAELIVFHADMNIRGVMDKAFTLGTSNLSSSQRQDFVDAIAHMTGFHYHEPEVHGFMVNLGYGDLDEEALQAEEDAILEVDSVIGSSPETPPHEMFHKHRQAFLNLPPDEMGGMVRFPKRQRVFSNPPDSADEEDLSDAEALLRCTRTTPFK